MSKRVLVTGATGFIAQHCIHQLLEAGYFVRGTARVAGRTSDVASVLTPHLSPGARENIASDFEVVPADLARGDCLTDAVVGRRCRLGNDRSRIVQ